MTLRRRAVLARRVAATAVASVLVLVGCSGEPDPGDRLAATPASSGDDTATGAAETADATFRLDTVAGTGRATASFADGADRIIVTTTGVFRATADATERLAELPASSRDQLVEQTADGAHVVAADPTVPGVRWVDLADGTVTAADIGIDAAVLELLRPAADAPSPIVAVTPLGMSWADGLGGWTPMTVPDGRTIVGRSAVLDGRRVVAPLDDGPDVWIASSVGAEVVPLPLDPGARIADVAASDDGSLIAVTAWSGDDAFERRDTVVVLDAATLTVVAQLPFTRPLEPTQWALFDDLVVVAAGTELSFWRPDGTPIASSSDLDEEIADIDRLGDDVITVGIGGQVTAWGTDATPRPVVDTDRAQRIRRSADRLDLVDPFGQVVSVGPTPADVSTDTRFATGALTSVAVDASGDRVVTTSDNGQIVVLDRDLEIMTSWAVADTPTEVGVAAYVGNTLATGVQARLTSLAFDDTVTFWEGEGASVARAGGDGDDVAGCSFYYARVEEVADGTAALVTSHDFTVQRVDPATGEIAWTTPSDGAPLLDMTVTPDDRYLVVADDVARVQVWNVEDGTYLTAYDAPVGGYRQLVARGRTPDDNELLTVDLVGNLAVIDALTGEQLRVLATTEFRPTAIAVSHDGALVAVAHGNDRVGIWSADTGAPLAELTGTGATITDLAFTPDDGALLGSEDAGTLVRWVRA